MRIVLSPNEARVIGCLVEKEITTPEQYPLSLNALTLACNQKTSRDPVMNLTQSQVQPVVDELVHRHLVSDRGGFGSRVTKYQHRFANVGFGSLEFTAQELGILCVLLLRGPQTAGELRSRTNRLCEFHDAHEVESVLAGLMRRSDGPFVARLAREAGERETRYRHLFDGDAPEAVDDVEDLSDIEMQAAVATARTPAAGPRPGERIEELELQVLALQEEVEGLKARLATLEAALGV